MEINLFLFLISKELTPTPIHAHTVNMSNPLEPIFLQYNLNSSNTDGSFTVDDSSSFFSPYKILPIAQENKYLGIFYLILSWNCMLCVHITPRWGDSMSTPNIQSLCWKSKKSYRYLFLELVPWITLSGSNYPCLERISMVPKMFESLRFDCISFAFNVIRFTNDSYLLHVYTWVY